MNHNEWVNHMKNQFNKYYMKSLVNVFGLAMTNKIKSILNKSELTENELDYLMHIELTLNSL
jgi:hypothetical protein